MTLIPFRAGCGEPATCIRRSAAPGGSAISARHCRLRGFIRLSSRPPSLGVRRPVCKTRSSRLSSEWKISTGMITSRREFFSSRLTCWKSWPPFADMNHGIDLDGFNKNTGNDDRMGRVSARGSGRAARAMESLPSCSAKSKTLGHGIFAMETHGGGSGQTTVSPPVASGGRRETPGAQVPAGMRRHS